MLRRTVSGGDPLLTGVSGAGVTSSGVPAKSAAANRSDGRSAAAVGSHWRDDDWGPPPVVSEQDLVHPEIATPTAGETIDCSSASADPLLKRPEVCPPPLPTAGPDTAHCKDGSSTGQQPTPREAWSATQPNPNQQPIGDTGLTRRTSKGKGAAIQCTAAGALSEFVTFSRRPRSTSHSGGCGGDSNFHVDNGPQHLTGASGGVPKPQPQPPQPPVYIPASESNASTTRSQSRGRSAFR